MTAKIEYDEKYDELYNIPEDGIINLSICISSLQFIKQKTKWTEQHQFCSYYYTEDGDKFYLQNGKKIISSVLDEWINYELDNYVSKVNRWCARSSDSRYKNAIVLGQPYFTHDVHNIADLASKNVDIKQYQTRNASYYFNKFFTLEKTLNRKIENVITIKKHEYEAFLRCRES